MNHLDFDWNLNYNYYLAETQKLIDMVLHESEKLIIKASKAQEFDV